MVSNLMQELRREDYERADDGEPQPDQPDFRRESYWNPPAMQPLDAGEESHTSVPVTSQPDGQPTILFRYSQVNLEETEVIGTDVLPSSTSIVARFIEPPPSVTENAVLENVRACQTVATTTITLTWSCSTGITTSINSLVTSASHKGPGKLNSSTTLTSSVPAEVQQNVPSSEELSYEEGGLVLPHAITGRTGLTRRYDGETRGYRPGSYSVWFEDESWRTQDDHRNQGFSQWSSVQQPPRQYRDRSDQQGSCGDWSSAEPYHQTEQERETSPYRCQANTPSLGRETSQLPSAPHQERETSPYQYQANTASLSRESSRRPSVPYLERENSPYRNHSHTYSLYRGTSHPHWERDTSSYGNQDTLASLCRGTSHPQELSRPHLEWETSSYGNQDTHASLHRGTSHPQEQSMPHLERETSSYWSQDNHASLFRGTSHPQELCRPHLERETSSYGNQDTHASSGRGTSHPQELSRPHRERETSSYWSRDTHASVHRGTFHSQELSRPPLERETSSSKYKDNYASPHRGTSHPHELCRPPLKRENTPYHDLDKLASLGRGTPHPYELSRAPLEQETTPYQYQGNQNVDSTFWSSIAESNLQRPGRCRVCQKSRHWRSACPEKYSRPCRNCGTLGHWIRECPEPTGNFANNNPGSKLNFE